MLSMSTDGIDWRPIADLPADRKDGREILLWQGGNMIGPDIGTWNPSGVFGGDGYWEALYEGAPISDVTHWADINPPA
jgi:hypothetical protein